jgi:hypothetical protein
VPFIGTGPTELSGTRIIGSGSPSGAIAGGQIGFNWQAGMFVFGAEIDGQWVWPGEHLHGRLRSRLHRRGNNKDQVARDRARSPLREERKQKLSAGLRARRQQGNGSGTMTNIRTHFKHNIFLLDEAGEILSDIGLNFKASRKPAGRAQDSMRIELRAESRITGLAGKASSVTLEKGHRGNRPDD